MTLFSILSLPPLNLRLDYPREGPPRTTQARMNRLESIVWHDFSGHPHLRHSRCRLNPSDWSRPLCCCPRRAIQYLHLCGHYHQISLPHRFDLNH